MKHEEMQALLSMMVAATKGSELDPQTRQFWEEQLSRLDAKRATDTVLAGIKVWEFFPSWKEFGQLFTDLGKLATAEGEYHVRRQTIAKPVRRPMETPFWVKRWTVARFFWDKLGLEGPDRRIFKEQLDYGVDPTTELMPEDTYLEEAKHLTDRDVYGAVLR